MCTLLRTFITHYQNQKTTHHHDITGQDKTTHTVMTNEEYIQDHLHDNVRSLALQKAPEGIDSKWCLTQIEGWQRAKEKLPRWAKTKGIWYPPALSMQQCSGQQTASYKAELVKRLLPLDQDRLSFADLTGGYGIDFSYMAPLFHSSHYVESNPDLCRIAEHNLPLLGLHNAQICCQDSTEFIRNTTHHYSLIYIDPARRDDIGRKTVAISDCTPDLCTIQELLLEHSRYIICKLSPMLDITAAISSIAHVRELHVVALKGECKELLIVIDACHTGKPSFHAVNLDTKDSTISATYQQRLSVTPLYPEDSLGTPLGHYLYEPNAALLKAGLHDVAAKTYGLAKLHPLSNLFTSLQPVQDFPGRCFRIESYCGFGKKELRTMLSDLTQANITIRNFPSSVTSLRCKLKLADGGDTYLFATTLHDGSHILLRCIKSA